MNVKRKRTIPIDKRIAKKRKLAEKKETEEKYFDLWTPAKDPLDIIIEEFPEVDKEYLVPLTKTYKPLKRISPSLIKAVELPNPGTSYNPDFGEHQILLKDAVDEQLKKRKEMKRVMAKLKAEQRTDWDPANEVDPLVLGTEDLGQEDASENEDDPGERVFNPHIPRILQAQRNKEARKRAREGAKRRKLEKKEGKRRLGMVEQFKTEIIEKEKVMEIRKEKREEKLAEVPYKTKRLGPETFKQPEIEVILPEQLPEKLMKFNSRGDPIMDRFQSFQKRNIIETRSLKQYTHRYRIKFIEKYDYKEFTREQAKLYADL